METPIHQAVLHGIHRFGKQKTLGAAQLFEAAAGVVPRSMEAPNSCVIGAAHQVVEILKFMFILFDMKS